MSDALANQGCKSAEELQKFIRLCDTFFDILNIQTSYTGTGHKAKKLALFPLKDDKDPRFKVFFLIYSF